MRPFSAPLRSPILPRSSHRTSRGASPPLFCLAAMLIAHPAHATTYDVSAGQTVTISTVIADGGSPETVDKTDTGTLIFTAANTYTGGTTVTGGTLALGAGGSLASTGSLSVASGATFDISAATAGIQTIGDLSGAGTVNLGANALVEGTTNNTSFSGVIEGTGAFDQQGTGTLTLSGANTYTGGTDITAGTLALGVGGSLASTGALSITSGATFDISGSGADQTIGDLSGAGTVTLGVYSLTEGTANNTTYAGIIGGTAGFTKQGTGVLTLTGVNTYTGGTTISAGTLALGAGGSLASTGAVAITSGATFDISAATGSQTIGDLSGAGTVTLGANGLTEGTANSTSFSGIIGGTGSLTKQGTGTLTLTGANTYTGGTTISAGTLALGAGGSLASTGAVSLSSNGIFDISAATGAQTIGDLSGTNGTEINFGANGLIVGTSNSTTYAGTTGGTGSLTKQGSGTLTLTGTNNYTGGTTITAGTLAMGAGGSLVSTGAVSIASGATLDISAETGSQTIGDLSGAGTINLGGNSMFEGTANNTSFSGIIGGTGSLLTQGTGTLTLTGANTYTGGTSILAGTLAIGSGGSLSSTGGLSVASGSTFDISAASSNQTIGDLSGAGTINLGSNGLTEGTDNSTSFSGVIQGAGSFTKQGSGTLTLTGANTYTGGTIVSAGILALGAGGSIITSTSSITVDTGATFDMSATTGNQTIGDISGGGNITLGSGGLTTGTSNNTIFSGVLAGASGLTKEGSGTLVLDGINTYSGATIVSAGTLEVGDASSPSSSITSDVTVDTSGTLRGHGTVIGSVTNNGVVAPGGSIGTLTVNGNYTQSSTGTLSVELSGAHASLLAVNGSASLAGTLLLTPDVGTLRGTKYTLLSATNGITGSFSTVTNTAPSVAAFNITETSNDVFATAYTGATNFSGIALTRDQAGIAGTLDRLSPITTTGSFNTFLNNLATMSVAGQQQSLSQLNGAIAATLPYANASDLRLMMSGIQSRLIASSTTPATDAPLLQAQQQTNQSANTYNTYWGAVPPQEPNNLTAWVQGFGQNTSYKTSSTSSGLTNDVGGGSTGIESRLGYDKRVGIMVSAANNNLTIKDAPQTGSETTYALGVYGSKGIAWGQGGAYGSPNKRIVFDGSVLVGYSTATTDRTVNIVNGTAQGTASGYDFGSTVGVSYPALLKDGSTLTTRLGANYTYSDVGGYTESGANGANLVVGDNSQSLLQSDLGVTWTRKFIVGSTPTPQYQYTNQYYGGYRTYGSYTPSTTLPNTITPDLHLSWLHELVDPRSSVTSSLAGVANSGFTSGGLDPARDTADFGAGLTYTFGARNISLYGRFDALVSSNMTGESITGGLRYTW